LKTRTCAGSAPTNGWSIPCFSDSTDPALSRPMLGVYANCASGGARSVGSRPPCSLKPHVVPYDAVLPGCGRVAWCSIRCRRGATLRTAPCSGSAFWLTTFIATFSSRGATSSDVDRRSPADSTRARVRRPEAPLMAGGARGHQPRPWRRCRGPSRSLSQGLSQPRAPRSHAAHLFGSPNVTPFVTGSKNRTLGWVQVAA
jgi:hypothetical protein